MKTMNTREQTRTNYNRMSKWYDLMAGAFEKKYRNAGLRKLYVNAGERILEIGFGTGHCIKSLAQLVGEQGKIHGIDLSEGMLEVTQKRLLSANLQSRAELINGDATQLPYNSNYFDGVFMSFTLELFSDCEIPVVLNESKRVMKDNGRLCIVTMYKKEKPNLMIKLYEWSHRKFPRIVDCRPIPVKQIIEKANLKIMNFTQMSLSGIPVAIVVAKKQN